MQTDETDKSGVGTGENAIPATPGKEAGDQSIKSEIKSFIEFFYIRSVPSYGNNFFFTIGIYLLHLFALDPP